MAQALADDSQAASGQGGMREKAQAQLKASSKLEGVAHYSGVRILGKAPKSLTNDAKFQNGGLKLCGCHTDKPPSMHTVFNISVSKLLLTFPFEPVKQVIPPHPLPQKFIQLI